MKLFDVYPLYPIEPVRGEGNYVYDRDGKRYLDLYGGHAVISIGHTHPHYVRSIISQLEQIGFYSNSVENSLQARLAEMLGRLSGYDDYSLFLANSGAEANENAIKLASFKTGKAKVLALGKAFHGRTSGAVAMTDNPKIVAPFNKTDNVEFVELNNLKAVAERLSSGEFCAMIVEGIQGVSGIHIPTDEFLQGVRKLCTENGVVLILDEIQSGYGRSGRFFAHQYSGIRPDLITMAKGMGNGFPIGGVLISPDFEPWYGMLGTTFGGNHLACAAAIAVLEVIEVQKLIANTAEVGAHLIEELKQIPEIKEVRGRGLMIGMEIEGSAADLRKKLLFEHRVFTGGAGAHTVRLLPALTLSKEEADHFITIIKRALA
ncbi:MAG: aminotransferase class III-fold pyridoxal phosphate-dependent enzyme [Rikenellaceae bacterium]